MTAAYAASMLATVERLEAERDQITGVVITSAKKTFFAGADLNDLKAASREQSDEVAKWVHDGKAVLRRLETLGKPVVAAVNGAALGGGLEICLACHHRVVVDDPKVQLGFPEVQLGLLPGLGGVTRTVRMMGIVNALMQLLMQGQRLRPAKALEIGLIDEVVPTREDLIPAAKKWIANNPDGSAALGCRQEVQDPGRHPEHAGAGTEPTRLPRQPPQADQGRQLPGAAPHHGRRGRGRPGRLRQRVRDRGALLRRSGHQPGRQEHDPGVLLRPAARDRRPRPSGRPGGLQADQDGRARRRDDGRRDRLRVRQGWARGRSEGRLARGRRARQGLLREAGRQGRRAGSLEPGTGRRAAGADHRDRRPGGRRKARSW